MSLGIAFKGAEGIVLAADSRVTLTATMQIPQPGGQPPQLMALPSTYDNATKLLRIKGHEYVGAVTYGAGALGGPNKPPRTAHSFMPEFEADVDKLCKEHNTKRLSVEDMAKALSSFFSRQWKTQNMPSTGVPDMVFLVGGYDADQPYGRVFDILIPSRPAPKEWHAGEFGMVWGGQKEYTDRLIVGYDPNLPEVVRQHLNLTPEQKAALESHIKGILQAPIPFQFLPLQDCVDLAALLIRTTITIQTFLMGIRGVGGAIDLATITRTEGLKAIQLKKITGEFEKLEDE
jgi:hypothetical protein